MKAWSSCDTPSAADPLSCRVQRAAGRTGMIVVVLQAKPPGAAWCRGLRRSRQSAGPAEQRRWNDYSFGANVQT